MYIVVKGLIYFYDKGKVIADARPKSTIGETRLFSQRSYKATAIAVKDTWVLELDQFILVQLINTQEDIAWAVINILVKHLRRNIRCPY